ncbi:TPA: serine hydrolase [Elizabethkingia anophelis]|uniref:class A beta-lactamase-related serine hydrolase n=1 Tax=Elizabethkingia anophelis TaxID=1117645 RepID=UPI0021A3DC6D|nr:class A beta-lactamase-related serine hydrolase [Elizabethkingia anophelis]MCT3682249.1 class A beta-lactamase-related serine hydrolase [Elizabethkingia anophelis]MCT3703911.1 class A beta-lactamase-related serine hydrolase [Elizabethkingia anophelis]MCT3771482.1 class A beta-lactamase-related serine hydrolase [Elizabethkingia anophelis]MCT3781736.1 class A beta-lactamase-related serine hydrolase [Elizabethkingia anophelis]
MTKYALFFISAGIGIFNALHAQADQNSKLYKAIMAKDSLLFSVGFNTCNLEQTERLLKEPFEFYHDKTGLADKKKFLTDLRNNLCSTPETFRARRALVNESTTIYPLYKDGRLYGAVQNGDHWFYATINKEPERLAGAAKFTHLWLLENGDWKLSRSLSFDHQPKENINQGSGFENDQTFESWLKENKIPVLGLGIIEEGALKQVKVFGEIKKGISAPYNSYFNVASLTKPVTAMVALRLVSLGKLKLDEPLDQYWTDPDIANDSRRKMLTTRIVLSHQTGFPNWRWNNKDKKLNFEFDSGTKYQYSGEGMEYLRKALERKFGKPLQVLASELIFQPLGMKDTDYIWNKNFDESRFAIGYDREVKPYPIEKRTTANAADDLITTVEDYGNFLVNVLKGGNLKSEVYQEMIKKQVKTGTDKYFGLGFEIYDLGNGEFALSHGGSDNGTRCLVFILPKTKNGILIFTNADEGYKVYEKLILQYLGKQGRKIVDIEMKK